MASISSFTLQYGQRSVGFTACRRTGYRYTRSQLHRKAFSRLVPYQESKEPGDALKSKAAVVKQTQRTPDIQDLDRDLTQVLELATDDELEEVYRLLFGRSLLSPLVKSLVAEASEPASVGWRGREAVIVRIEHRFRFLAADAAGIIKGRWPSYRETLVQVRDRLGVRCPGNLDTQDLETEIFLHLLDRHSDAVDAVSVDTYSAAATAQALEGDGMALPQSPQDPSLLERLVSPLRLGQQEVLPAVTKLAGIVAVGNLQGAALRRLGMQVLCWQARYESAMQIMVAAGTKGAVAGLRSKAAVQVAQQGLTAAASRYAAVRGVMALAGPLMWTLLGLDLARMSLGTDYARIVKAVFAIAQIRLLRTHGFHNSEQQS